MACVSIIVPVYNAELYLARCVESILAQTFSDFELILVNDGSTDGSLDICGDYQNKDTRVNVINKPNGGASSARNCGIEVAKGDFICFVDADDYLNDQYIEDLYNDMKMYGPDLVMHGMVKLDNGNQTIYSLDNNKKFYLKDKDGFFKNTNLFMFCGPYCKLLKVDILKKFGIRFNQQIICAEDYDFFANYLVHCRTVKVSAIQNYYYESHDDSVSRRVYSFIKEYTGLQELYLTLDKLCNQFDDDALKLQVNSFLAYYVTRVLASNYKKPMIERSCRLSNLSKIDRKFVDIFHQYDKPSTLFLKLAKFLFVHHCYRLYDLAYSIAIRS